MTESSNASSSPDAANPSLARRNRRRGLGCLLFAAIALIAFGVASARASADLDLRLAQASEEIQGLQVRGEASRPTVLGQPKNEENALVDYNGLQWVLTPAGSGGRPASWEKHPPPLPPDVDEVSRSVTTKDGDVGVSSLLLAGIDSIVGEDAASAGGAADHARAIRFSSLPVVETPVCRSRADHLVPLQEGL